MKRVKTTTKKKATKKTTKTRLSKTRKVAAKRVSQEERLGIIRNSAYLKAENDAFQRDPVEYWLAAEDEVDKALRKGR